MTEIKDLITKARRFVKTAELLLEYGDCDSVASRCYHAMLLAARALLLTKGVRPRSEKSTIMFLVEHFIQPGELDPGQGRVLRRAFELKQRGDETIELPVDREEATELLDRTMWFLDAIEGALGSSRE